MAADGGGGSYADVEIIVHQDGGERLGQGGYGCTFRPPLICQGRPRRPNPARIGKLTDLEDAEIEVAFARYFRNVPDAKKYLWLPHLDTYCKPAPLKQQQDKSGILKCKDKVEIKHPGKFIFEKKRHFEMDYGGIQLKDFALNLPKDFDFFKYMRQVLEIGAFLVLHGVVHNDLHSENILVDTNYTPRLIDYGRSYIIASFDRERLNELRAHFTASLSQIPPEMSMIDGEDVGHSLAYMLNIFKKRNPVMHDYAEKLLGIPMTRQLTELKAFWTSSMAVQKQDWLTFYKLYWPVVDAWSFGALIMKVYRQMILSRSFTDSPAWKEREPTFKMIVRGLLRTSPRNRLDCVEALFLYDPTNELVTSAAGVAWLEKRQSYRKSQKGGGGSGAGNAAPDMEGDDYDDDPYGDFD
jgi:hypothetical protein